MPVVNRRQSKANTCASSQAVIWSKKHDPYGIVKLARERSKAAIMKLEKLMNGDAGMMKVMHPVTGDIIELPIEVPPAVQVKCAELIIERGYGKSPQAILIQDDTSAGAERRLTTAEKILAIQQAREGAGRTTDLEASEIVEVQATPAASTSLELVPVSPLPPGRAPDPASPEDLI